MTKLNWLYQFTGICLLILWAIPAHSQINILVGYGLGYSEYNGINEVIDDHNDANDWYKSEFDQLKFIHGLNLGLRYAWPRAKVVLNYKNSGLRKKAEGIPPNEEEAFNGQLFIRNNILGFGVESHYDIINWGVSLDYNFLKISTETSDLSDSYVLQNDRYLSAHFYLNLDFYGEGNIGFTLQPYVQIPLQDVSLKGLSMELGVSSQAVHKPYIFGLTLLMVNGPQ